MSKHLPAPWEFSSSAIWAISPWNARITIAHVHTFSATNGISSEANGRLIAAAPELLAGCVAMLGHMESGFLLRNTASDHKGDWALRGLAFVRDLQAMHAAITKATGAA